MPQIRTVEVDKGSVYEKSIRIGLLVINLMGVGGLLLKIKKNKIKVKK